MSGKLTLVVFDFAGRRDDDEDAVEKLYTLATHVPMTSFKVST